MNGKIILETKIPETKRTKLSTRISQKPIHPASPADRILSLQRTIGNQAVARLIRSGTLQAKLRIGRPGDIYEQEADRVAEKVMRMPEQRISKESSGHAIMDGMDESFINTIHSGGQPLPESLRTFFEPRFGHDFGRVRMHTDTKAAEAARAVNARAFTVGSDVVFGEGQYAPGTSEGRRLMAHELVHVVQQAPATEPQRIQRFAYGAGGPIVFNGRRFVQVPAAHRTGANGVNAAMALIAGLIARGDWRGRTCRNFYGPAPGGNCPSGETLAQLHNRAVIWFEDIAPAGVLATTQGLGGPNIGYTQELFNVRSPWALAASFIHEYIHLCGEASHDVGDNAKLACGLPNI